MRSFGDAACAALLLAVPLVAGCSTNDRSALTRFEPTEHGEFRYVAGAPIDYPENSAAAEATRMEWLRAYLDLNDLCARGYEITERKPVLTRQAILGDVHTIYYRGRCR